MRTVVATIVATIAASMLVCVSVVAGCEDQILVPGPHDTGPPGEDVDPNQPFPDQDSGVDDGEVSTFAPYDASCHADADDGWTWDRFDPLTEYLPAPDCYDTGTPDVGDETDASVSDGDSDVVIDDVSFETASDASVDADDGESIVDTGPTVMPGSRFCEIYRDIIHHDGDAKCQSLGCHGGDHGRNSFAMGWTMESCYFAMTHFETCHPPPTSILVNPTTDGSSSYGISALPYVLTFMPDTMSYPASVLHDVKLSGHDLERVRAWLDRGAPMD
jgi:hypothetical protein